MQLSVARYVQHLITEHGSLLWDMVRNRNASIFIAGSSKNMPQSVRESFVKIAQAHGELTPDEAELFVADMEKKNRYQTETWG